MENLFEEPPKQRLSEEKSKPLFKDLHVVVDMPISLEEKLPDNIPTVHRRSKPKKSTKPSFNSSNTFAAAMSEWEREKEMKEDEARDNRSKS